MISPGIHISLNKYRSLNGSAFIRLVPHHRKEIQQDSDRLNIQKRHKIHFYKLTINIMRQLSFHLSRQLERNVLLLQSSLIGDSGRTVVLNLDKKTLIEILICTNKYRECIVTCFRLTWNVSCHIW